MTETQVQEMSVEELKALLAQKEKAAREAQQKARQQYEKERDVTIVNLVKRAEELSEWLSNFKKACHDLMAAQEGKLREYGEIRSNSKGGFGVTHSNGNLRVIRRRDTEPHWDERSIKAVELIKEFLYDKVKKRDVKQFQMLMSFITKNKNGDLEYSKVFSMIQHEQMWDDPRWLEGLRLLKESYSVTMKAFTYEFKVRDEGGKWDGITLNFSSL